MMEPLGAVVSVRVVSECPGCDGATVSRCISEVRIRVAGL